MVKPIQHNMLLVKRQSVQVKIVGFVPQDFWVVDHLLDQVNPGQVSSLVDLNT